jgi:hypothetical protein
MEFHLISIFISLTGNAPKGLKEEHFSMLTGSKKCPNEHELKFEATPFARADRFKCQGCSMLGSGARFCCGPCDFNLCHICSPPPPGSETKCMSNHQLVWQNSQTTPAYRCSKCGFELGCGERWCCNGCGYNLCYACETPPPFPSIFIEFEYRYRRSLSLQK